MNNTLHRLAHRLRLANNLGLEDDIVPIALKIAEEVLKEIEEMENSNETMDMHDTRS